MWGREPVLRGLTDSEIAALQADDIHRATQLIRQARGAQA
jgi:hypothetical protein